MITERRSEYVECGSGNDELLYASRRYGAGRPIVKHAVAVAVDDGKTPALRSRRRGGEGVAQLTVGTANIGCVPHRTGRGRQQCRQLAHEIRRRTYVGQSRRRVGRAIATP